MHARYTTALLTIEMNLHGLLPYLYTYSLITYSTIYKWLRDLALLCMCVGGTPWYILRVTGDPHMRSWWLGLSSGSEQLKPIVRLGARGMCWARPTSTYGGYESSHFGDESSGIQDSIARCMWAIPVMGAGCRLLRWRRVVTKMLVSASKDRVSWTRWQNFDYVHTAYPLWGRIRSELATHGAKPAGG